MGSDFGSALELYLFDLGEGISSLWTSVSPFENGKIELRGSLRILQLYQSPNSLSLGLMLFKKTVCKSHICTSPTLCINGVGGSLYGVSDGCGEGTLPKISQSLIPLPKCLEFHHSRVVPSLSPYFRMPIPGGGQQIIGGRELLF